ncbi:hypothetical protein FRC12_006331, partial [Ceratobasidium sp. 428]
TGSSSSTTEPPPGDGQISTSQTRIAIALLSAAGPHPPAMQAGVVVRRYETYRQQPSVAARQARVQASKRVDSRVR